MCGQQILGEESARKRGFFKMVGLKRRLSRKKRCLLMRMQNSKRRQSLLENVLFSLQNRRWFLLRFCFITVWSVRTEKYLASALQTTLPLGISERTSKSYNIYIQREGVCMQHLISLATFQVFVF